VSARTDGTESSKCPSCCSVLGPLRAALCLDAGDIREFTKDPNSVWLWVELKSQKPYMISDTDLYFVLLFFICGSYLFISCLHTFLLQKHTLHVIAGSGRSRAPFLTITNVTQGNNKDCSSTSSYTVSLLTSPSWRYYNTFNNNWNGQSLLNPSIWMEY